MLPVIENTLVDYLKKFEEMQIGLHHIKIEHMPFPSDNSGPWHCYIEELTSLINWCEENNKKYKLCIVTGEDMAAAGYERTKIKGTKQYQYRKELSYTQFCEGIEKWKNNTDNEIVCTIERTDDTRSGSGDDSKDGGGAGGKGGGGGNGSGGCGNSFDIGDGDDGDESFITATAAEYIPKIMKGKQPYHYWKLEKCKYKGEGKVVAIIDSGVDETHPAFFDDGTDPSTSKIILGVNFVDEIGYVTDKTGHGTMCAGVACGSGFETLTAHKQKTPWGKPQSYVEYPSGVASKAKLIICKVRSSTSEGYRHDAMVCAFEWIKENCTGKNPPSQIHVDVVSCSIGRKKYSQRLEHAISAH